MQTYFKQLFAILLIGLSFATKAQNTVYPVQLNAVILPPFTNCLGDYVSPENNRFKLTALVRDLSYRNKLDVSVSLKVKSGNSVVLETKSPVQQTLEKVSVLTPIDTRALFDPNNPKGGLNYKGSYANNGWCLPEGYYEFVFQLFDYHDRKLPLSEPVSMFCYLAESEPPICVYPNANDCVDQPVINFQWMDASSMGIQQKKYVFELYEVGNYSKMAQVATMFGDKSVSGMTAVAKEVVFTNTYSFTLTNHLLEGHDYMWRVRVESKSGDQMAAYKNNGYSQWQMFTYVCKEHKKASTLDESVIPEIVSFTEVESVKGAGVVTWKANEHFCGYILKYQNKEYDLEEWASVNVSDSRVDNGDGTYSFTLDKLAEGETFLATITGIVNCNSDETRTTSPESEQKSVTLSKSSAASSESPKEEDGDCKVNVPEVQDNGDITELKEGDIFYANGNFVKVVGTPTNNGGKFTGKGIYSFSFLKGLVGVNVEYSDVRISMVDNINQLIEGEVKAVHDDNDNMMLNINSLINKSNTGTGECAVQTDITTTKMTQDEFDKMISSDQASSYVGVLIEVDNKDLYTVEDKGNGAYAQVKLGEVLDAEKFCKPLKNGLDSENDECVKFSPLADWNPPFDYECTPFCDNINTRNSYKKEDGYAVPWIAMPQNSYNTIKAEIRGNINTSDLAFYCYTDNKVVKLNAESKGNGTYEIKIFSGDVNYQLRIFAMYQKCDNQCEDLDKDCNNTKTLGRAQIYTLSRKTHKIKLVPVFKEITIDKSDLENKLNKLYEALGQKFELEVESTVFNDESIASLNADKAFELDDVSAFDRESASMTTLKNAYANSKTKDELKGYSAFIFILPSNVASSSSVKGEMPRSSSVGYVFGDGSYTDSHTLAHELAHGLFSMEHTFSIFPSVAQGSTDNLMDYGNKENLKYWQWLLVQNPKSYVLPFMDDASDAQISADVKKCIMRGVGSAVIGTAFDKAFEYAESENFDEFYKTLDLKSELINFLFSSGTSAIDQCADDLGDLKDKNGKETELAKKAKKVQLIKDLAKPLIDFGTCLYEGKKPAECCFFDLSTDYITSLFIAPLVEKILGALDKRNVPVNRLVVTATVIFEGFGVPDIIAKKFATTIVQSTVNGHDANKQRDEIITEVAAECFKQLCQDLSPTNVYANISTYSKGNGYYLVYYSLISNDVSNFSLDYCTVNSKKCTDGGSVEDALTIDKQNVVYKLYDNTSVKERLKSFIKLLDNQSSLGGQTLSDNIKDYCVLVHCDENDKKEIEFVPNPSYEDDKDKKEKEVRSLTRIARPCDNAEVPQIECCELTDEERTRFGLSSKAYLQKDNTKSSDGSNQTGIVIEPDCPNLKRKYTCVNCDITVEDCTVPWTPAIKKKFNLPSNASLKDGYVSFTTDCCTFKFKANIQCCEVKSIIDFSVPNFTVISETTGTKVYYNNELLDIDDSKIQWPDTLIDCNSVFVKGVQYTYEDYFTEDLIKMYYLQIVDHLMAKSNPHSTSYDNFSKTMEKFCQKEDKISSKFAYTYHTEWNKVLANQGLVDYASDKLNFCYNDEINWPTLHGNVIKDLKEYTKGCKITPLKCLLAELIRSMTNNLLKENSSTDFVKNGAITFTELPYGASKEFTYTHDIKGQDNLFNNSLSEFLVKLYHKKSNRKETVFNPVNNSLDYYNSIFSNSTSFYSIPNCLLKSKDCCK